MDLDFVVFKEGMDMLCVVANREPSDILLSTYYAVLRDLAEDQFKSAVRNLLLDRQYTNLPIPANIREAAIGKVDNEALIALDKLERAAFVHGMYCTVAFDDPIIHAIVQSMGGWPKVCGQPEGEWKFKRMEFLKVYKAFAPNLHRLQVPAKLIGIDEANNPTRQHRVAYVGGELAVRAWQERLGTVERSSISLASETAQLMVTV